MNRGLDCPTAGIRNWVIAPVVVTFAIRSLPVRVTHKFPSGPLAMVFGATNAAKSSADDTVVTELSKPPATRVCPFKRAVAVAPWRPVPILLVGVHKPVLGLYVSAEAIAKFVPSVPP